ncbi:hypothetical protein ES703_106856 [subsurface metagenome]
MALLYMRRLQRHGNGREIRMPTEVCRELGITTGDYVAFEFEPGDGAVKLSKPALGEHRDGEAKEEKAVTPAAISPR